MHFTEAPTEWLRLEETSGGHRLIIFLYYFLGLSEHVKRKCDQAAKFVAEQIFLWRFGGSSKSGLDET